MTIKEARLQAGLSQAKMSKLLEIPIRTIENWESGQRKPSEWVEKLIIKELGRMSNPFKNLKATAVIGKPLPENFEYAAEYTVETPTGHIGALLKNKNTGIYVVVCGGITYNCPQDWANSVVEHISE